MMNLSSLKKKPVVYVLLLGFVIMLFVQWALLNNAYKGKEKDFNDKFFYLVRVYEDQLTKDSAAMNRLLTIDSVIDLTRTRIHKELDSVFRNNDIPTDVAFAVGRATFEDRKTKIDSNLVWSSDPVYNGGLKATKLRISNLGPKGAKTYYIKVFLPTKPDFLIRSLLPLIVLLVFTLFMLFFCFLALISTIKKQSKLAELKNDFINNMTHELKTPLFTISIASRMLAEQEPIKENQKYSSYVTSIQQETDRLTKLVEKVLQTSSLEKKQLQLDKKDMDLHASIRSVIKSLELRRVEQQAEITLFLNATAHYIHADETHMTSVIYSMLDNAFKYSNGPAHISISTKNEGDCIVTGIMDDGIGLDAATKAMVFDRFFRAHTGDLHEVKGYGIGLSYVKSIIEAHDGSVKVESKTGKGSEFFILLPTVSHGK